VCVDPVVSAGIVTQFVTHGPGIGSSAAWRW
jgi:hypothetical protein